MSDTRMSLKEKIALCSGRDFWHTKAMTQHGVPSIMMCDGPHGLRKQENASDMLGLNESVPATCFPTAVSTACSWDEELLSEIGHAIGREAAANGVALVLGPGANIKRNPLCGRNFEYFSEDPLLAGKLAAAWIRGMESTGVGASLKHFACNSQEYKRFDSDSVIDERSLREIYLAAFEIAVKEGRPSTVMSAYNKINGTYCSDNRRLLTEILRKEWGFDGAVVTDWGAMSDRIAAFRAGCDLLMPGGSAYMEKEAACAVGDGSLSAADIDRSAARVRRLVQRGVRAVHGALPVDMDRHHALARRAAAESAVLMKNKDHLLPVLEDDVVFIGHMAQFPRFQGTGSSHINPRRLVSAVEACPNVPYAAGCDGRGESSDALIEEAVRAARSARVAVVFAGLSEAYESEGFDRRDMSMPAGHLRMIEAVADVNPNTVVVLFCGSPVEMPWADRVKSILYMGLPGEAGGEAAADLLFGRISPSGKLAESWPVRYSDCVSSSYYAGTRRDAHYREGVYVGYRHYASAGVQLRYPFGHGLSYAEFAYSDLCLEGDTLSCRITNTGAAAGSEVVQLYIAPPEGPFHRPALELKGFHKLSLKPGESGIVRFRLDERSFAVWNDGWVVPGGAYTLYVGGSSEKLPLSAKLERPHHELSAPQLPAWYFSPKGAPSHGDFERLMGRRVVEIERRKGEFTMQSTLCEMKDHSLVMRFLYWMLESVIALKHGGMKRARSNPSFHMMMTSATDSTLSCMKINAGMKNYLLEGLLEMANGRFFRGIGVMLGIK